MDSPYTLKRCAKCQKCFHKKCFADSKKNKTYSGIFHYLVCNSCVPKISNIVKEIKLSEYFSSNIKENENLIQTGMFIKLSENDLMCSSKDFIRNFEEKYINYSQYIEKYHENLKLKAFKIACPKVNKKLKETMLHSMLIKGFKFCDDLVYFSSDIEVMNKASKEPGLFPTSEHNRSIFYQCKKLTRCGNYPGLEIIVDEVQGFIVQAAMDIPSLTFICEYAGEVVPQRKVFFDSDNDSIMELLKAPSSADCLVIKPEKYCNIARFISGINNHKSDSYKKINVNSVKMNIDGQAHILLYASRMIKSGEILYYDYNRGGYEYPTENFI